MANEIVKYRNRLNDLNLTNLNSSELNLFIAIVSRLRDKENRKITFTREELKELSEFSDRHYTKFNKVIDGIAYKVFDIPLKYITETGSQKGIHLFSAFEIAKDYSTLTLTVSLEAVGFFNVLTDNFTRFSLYQFTQLKSKYSKTMFMLLKQYRTTGVRMLTKEDFNKLLGVPKSYQPCNVDKFILAPIRKELTPIFANLNITKVKKHNRILGYNIRFDKEAPKKDDFDHSKGKNNLAKAFNKIKPPVDPEQTEDDGWGII